MNPQQQLQALIDGARRQAQTNAPNIANVLAPGLMPVVNKGVGLLSPVVRSAAKTPVIKKPVMPSATYSPFGSYGDALNSGGPSMAADALSQIPSNLANQAANAIATEAGYRFSHEGALDLFNTGLNAIAQLSPASMPVGRLKADANPSLTTQSAGGGALKLGANVANFGSGIAGQGFDKFKLPTSLQNAMAKLPVTAAIAENLPQAVIPTASIFGKGKPLINLAADALSQAAISGIASEGDAQQRLTNAALGGALSVGAAGVGKVLDNVLPKKVEPITHDLFDDSPVKVVDKPKVFEGVKQDIETLKIDKPIDTNAMLQRFRRLNDTDLKAEFSKLDQDTINRVGKQVGC